MRPIVSCAHSIVKLRAMVIHVRVYARRLTIHIHFTQAQPCRNYRYMPRSWPYTELRNGKKRGIDQSETSSHLTHLIYYIIVLEFKENLICWSCMEILPSPGTFVLQQDKLFILIAALSPPGCINGDPVYRMRKMWSIYLPVAPW